MIQSNEELGHSLHLQSYDALMVKKGRIMEDTRHAQLFDNGIAVIDLIGPIFPRANMMTLSGATSIARFTQDLMRAYNHPDVKGVVLNVDSPGGDVRGIGDAARVISEIAKKGKKPMKAFASGYMASAAYYIASAVGQDNLIASESGIIGSIGVVSTLQKKNDNHIEIVSAQSPMKRADPSTDAGRAQVQQTVDDLAAIFVKDVATYRRVGQDKVLADYGQGATFVAPRALKQGLVDKVGTLSGVVEQMAADPKKVSRGYKAVDGTDVASILCFSEEDNMGLKDFINKFKASDDTIEDGANDEQAQNATTGEESNDTPAVAPQGQEEPATEANEGGTIPAPAVVAEAVQGQLTREQLEDRHSDSAELFAHQMITDNRIVPALGAYAASDLLNAMADDALVGGSVNFVDEKGQLASGTREAAIRSRYKAMPKHSLTQQAIVGIKDGTVEAKVLAEGLLETATDGPMTDERKRELLAMSSQGQAVLNAQK